jgi:hypothetical protein|tara:strand:+ start:99 stop:275 length:177 start_codon:yes stop_codon:yes gene_type:complete
MVINKFRATELGEALLDAAQKVSETKNDQAVILSGDILLAAPHNQSLIDYDVVAIVKY